MTVLTPAQAYAYAVNAGFSGSSAVIATAIAGAESNYRDDAVGDVNLSTSGEKSVGLWQINYRPARDALGGARDPQANLDPRHNAAAAFSISGGGKNFTPWSTYTSGAYRSYLPAALTAAHTAGNNPTLPQGSSTDTSSSSGSSSNPLLGGGGGLNLNPLDGFGIGSTVVAGLTKVIVPTIFVLAGVALVGGGLYKAATSKSGGTSRPPVADLAALAAL